MAKKYANVSASYADAAGMLPLGRKDFFELSTDERLVLSDLMKRTTYNPRDTGRSKSRSYYYALQRIYWRGKPFK
jgi:hypothetical protein